MANPENIKPYRFKPGNQAARKAKGTPKATRSFDALLKRIAEDSTRAKDPITGKRRMMTFYEAIAWQIIRGAVRGDYRMVKLFAERVGGLPKQAIDVSYTEKLDEWKEAFDRIGMQEKRSVEDE